jgi:hypothetical protein
MHAFTTTVARSIATGAAAIGISALLAGTAVADTSVFTDARGDLDHGADIHRVRVTHAAGDVTVSVRHDDLRPSFRSGSSIALYLDTDRDRAGAEYVFLGGTFRGSDYALLPARQWRRASDRQVPLRGGHYEMELDFAKDTAVVTIDRRVLRNPAAVRVEVKTGGQLVPEGSEPATTGRDWLGKARHFTPWVARG